MGAQRGIGMGRNRHGSESAWVGRGLGVWLSFVVGTVFCFVKLLSGIREFALHRLRPLGCIIHLYRPLATGGSLLHKDKKTVFFRECARR
jgi:hypothetical protein